MLGGSDFDICLNNYLLNRVRSCAVAFCCVSCMIRFLQISNGAEVVAGVESPVILDTKSGSCTDLSYIRYSAEQIKKELSFSETSDFSCAQKVFFPFFRNVASFPISALLFFCRVKNYCSFQYLDTTLKVGISPSRGCSLCSLFCIDCRGVSRSFPTFHGSCQSLTHRLRYITVLCY